MMSMLTEQSNKVLKFVRFVLVMLGVVVIARRVIEARATEHLDRSAGQPEHSKVLNTNEVSGYTYGWLRLSSKTL